MAQSRDGYTLLTLPTGFFLKWVSSMTTLDLDLPKQLRVVYMGGEKIPASTFNQWQRLTQGRVHFGIHTVRPKTAVAVTSFCNE